MVQRKQTIENILTNFHSLRHTFAGGAHDVDKDFGITRAQATVLFLIKHKGEMRVTAIANELGISKSASTQLIDNLVKQKMLDREVDKTDKRIFNIKLTETSKKQIMNFRQKSLNKMATIFETLDDDDLIQLEHITKKLLRNN